MSSIVRPLPAPPTYSATAPSPSAFKRRGQRTLQILVRLRRRRARTPSSPPPLLLRTL